MCTFWGLISAEQASNRTPCASFKNRSVKGVSTGRGAENGILFKSAESLELLHTIDTIVLDKTGTVTEGKPEVTDLLPAGGVLPAELLRIAAAIEHASEHPLAAAILRRAGSFIRIKRFRLSRPAF